MSQGVRAERRWRYAVTVHVFDAQGRRLGAWEADKHGGAPRMMPFNGPQTVSISIPRPYATAEMCRFGNLVVIESTSGVELWGGVIRGPRRWSLEGPTITIASWETFLHDLYTPTTITLRGLTVGQVAERLLTDALYRQRAPIAIGYIADVGPVLPWTFRAETLLSVLQSLRSLGHSEGQETSTQEPILPGMAEEPFDWYIETHWSDYEDRPHGLFFLTPRAGRDSGVLLSEGVNVVSVDKIEDDTEAVNTATVIGNSDNAWGERPTATAHDATLLAELLWPRTTIAVRSDLRDYSAVRQAAQRALKGVQERLVVNVTNGQGEWAIIRNGDMVWCDLPSFDFIRATSGPYPRRVVGREVSEADGIQRLQLVRGKQG